MRDKATVMNALSRMGERPGAAARSLDAFERAARALSRNHPRLIDEYPDQWVAIADGAVIAHGDSIGGVLQRIDERGVPRSDVIVRFIERTRRTLVL